MSVISGPRFSGSPMAVYVLYHIFETPNSISLSIQLSIYSSVHAENKNNRKERKSSDFFCLFKSFSQTFSFVEVAPRPNVGKKKKTAFFSIKSVACWIGSLSISTLTIM